jgi:hypothetical protein
MKQLFKVVVFEKPKNSITEAGINEVYWIVADSISKVGEKYPKAESITLITKDLITLK